MGGRGGSRLSLCIEFMMSHREDWEWRSFLLESRLHIGKHAQVGRVNVNFVKRALVYVQLPFSHL
jgi:hypothetical protein